MKKINWIYMAKGIACVLIFMVHYTAGFSKNIFCMESVVSMPSFRFLTAGSFSVCLFLQISAFLIADKIKRIQDLKEVGKLCIRRYLRLVTAVLVSAVFAYIIQETIGFYNLKLGTMLGNEWLMGYYTKPLELKEIFYTSLYKVLWQGNYDFDPPLWMLTTLFKGSYLAVVLALIMKYLEKWYGRFTVLFVLFIIYFFQNSMYISIVMGVAWSCVSSGDLFCRIKKSDRHRSLYSVFLVAMIIVFTGSLGYCGRAISLFGRYLSESNYILHEKLYFWSTLIVFAILLCMDLLFTWKGDLNENNPFVKLGKISMGVYLFHWPVLSSVFALAYIKYVLPGNSGMRIGVHCLTALAVVVIIAFIYERYVEKYINKLISFV